MNTNPNTKTVICYGDSNTWGQVPNVDKRYPADVRWTGVLQQELGNAYDVVNEGLCARTFVAEHPDKPHRTGITHLRSILKTNSPFDVITVMLGTNDMRGLYNLTTVDIAEHLRTTIKMIKEENNSADIIVICPPPVVNPKNGELFDDLKNALTLSLELGDKYKAVADDMNCKYVNAGDFISLEDTDGYHLGKEHQEIFGKKVASLIG